MPPGKARHPPLRTTAFDENFRWNAIPDYFAEEEDDMPMILSVQTVTCSTNQMLRKTHAV